MKLVYLDQLAWIELAKSSKQNPKLVDYYKKLVDNEKIIFPLSLSHFIETTKSPRPDQRNLLASLMTNLSKGLLISNDRKHTVNELENAFIKFFHLKIPTKEVNIFTRDFFELIGENILKKVDETFPHTVKAFLSTPNGIRKLLSSSNIKVRNEYLGKYYSFNKKVKKEDESYIDKIKGRNKNEIKRIYAAKVMAGFLPEINTLLDKFPISKSNLTSLKPKQALDLIHYIPTLDVELELRVLRDIQWSRGVDINDLDDLSFLNISIPYCDYIVTEKFWGHLGSQANLNTKYDTKFLNSMEDLKTELEIN